jgi:hypothetical protein
MTNMLWPARMPTTRAALYLQEEAGLPVEPKTLRNWRALGRGPKCRYLGTLPIYERDELDRWAQAALSDETPLSKPRRPRSAVRQPAA